MARADEGLPFLLRYENMANYRNGEVWILDRRKYPIKEEFVRCTLISLHGLSNFLLCHAWFDRVYLFDSNLYDRLWPWPFSFLLPLCHSFKEIPAAQ